MGNKKGDSEALEEQEFEEEERSKKKKNKTGTQSNSFPLSSIYAIPPSVARLITVQLIGGYNNGPSPDNGPCRAQEEFELLPLVFMTSCLKHHSINRPA